MAENEPKKSNYFAMRFFDQGISGTATITNMHVDDVARNHYRQAVPFDGSVICFQLDSGIVEVGSGSITARLLDGGTGALGVGSVALSSSASLGFTGTNQVTLVRGAYPVSQGDFLSVAYTSGTFDAGASSSITALVVIHIEEN